MMHYLVLVHRDGATATMHFPNQEMAEATFETVIAQPGVIYAHHAEVFGEPTNIYCQGTSFDRADVVPAPAPNKSALENVARHVMSDIDPACLVEDDHPQASLADLQRMAEAALAEGR